MSDLDTGNPAADEIWRLNRENHRLSELVRVVDVVNGELRAGLRESIRLLCHAASRWTDEYDDKIADLRKLLGGES